MGQRERDKLQHQTTRGLVMSLVGSVSMEGSYAGLGAGAPPSATEHQQVQASALSLSDK